MSHKKLGGGKVPLRLLYLGHSGLQITILTGALESNDIPFIIKREFGLQDQAPTFFFSPGTEAKIYVAEGDWERAVEMAQTVLGEDWEEPTEDE